MFFSTFARCRSGRVCVTTMAIAVRKTCSEHCVDVGQGGRICNSTSGRCLHGCTHGWQGPMCTGCVAGKYGNTCSEDCGQCRGGKTSCDTTTGRCPGGCKTGWKTPLCKGCVAGKHGDTCSEDCGQCQGGKNSCNTTTGHCSQGCKTGWKQPMCKECNVGYFKYRGQERCEKCGEGCQGSECQGPDGHCVCRPGWRPPKCKNRCTDRTWGQDCTQSCGQCKWSRPCAPENGTCSSGCEEGFSEPQCKDCISGHYTKDNGGRKRCKKCGAGCQGSECQGPDGHCVCSLGWMPPMCQEKCTDRKWGQNCTHSCGQCKRSHPCVPENGTCSSGCKKGFSEPQCKDCISGHYTKDSGGWKRCEKCGTGCQRSECRGSDGHCVCRPGWMPPMCQEKCTNRTWGRDCTHSCGQCNGSAVCVPENGTCPSGCVEGFSEPLCQEAMEQEGEGTDTSWIGVGVVVLVLVVVVVVAIILVKRFNLWPKRNMPSGSVTNQQQPTATDNSRPMVAMNPQPQPTNDPGHARYVNAPTPNQAQSPSLAATFSADASPLYAQVTRYPHSGASREASSRMPEKPGRGAEMNTDDGGAAGGGEFLYLNALGKKKTPSKPLWKKRKKAEDGGGEKTTAMAMGHMEGREEEEQEEEDEDVYTHGDLYAQCPVVQNRQSMLDSFQTRLLHCLAHPEELSQQFKNLPPGMQYPAEASRLPVNANKNRFKKLGAYEKNRVVLNRPARGDETDYINASFIKGVQSHKDYIATQGPRPNTLGDLWWMVWQEGVEQIIMVTNLIEHDRDKCTEYWPPWGETVTYGQITVTLQHVEEKTDFDIRTFAISLAGNSVRRTVHQYHYLAWPDHGVPVATSLVRFWRYVTAHVTTPNAPPLVHCSAGVGRTGTYIALDIACKRKSRGLDVNVHSIVIELREQRSIMVQAEAQYKFLHEVVLEEHNSCGTVMTLDQLDLHLPDPVDVHSTHPTIDPQFQVLKQLKTWAKQNTSIALMAENKKKNRDLTILPDNNQLIYLDMCKGRNQYINAIFMSSLLVRKGVLLTQLPLPNTVVDLWRLVDGHDVHLIVSLGDHHPSSVKSYASYWPQTPKQTVKEGKYSVRLENVSRVSETLSLYHLRLDNEDGERSVKVLHYTDWTTELPGSSSDVLHLIDLLKQEVEQVASPVIIQCLDGATQSGLFYVLCDLVSRMMEDKEVDLFSTVRYLHQVRPQALTTETQYRYCFRMAQDFRDSQILYSNT
ncbi:uncharacterized protein LOC143299545 [Babylonia areolata]|uniref:uncharacterized protein LOC143299545 n=1 Tax=Babylonia areolata TaxID=304850 RepID=UPI003FD5F6DA